MEENLWGCVEDRIEIAKRGIRQFWRGDNFGGGETEKQIEEEICSLELFGYVFDFPLRLIGSLVLTAEG